MADSIRGIGEEIVNNEDAITKKLWAVRKLAFFTVAEVMALFVWAILF